MGSVEARRGKAGQGADRRTGQARLIESRDNPRIKRWARLARDGRYRKAEGCAMVEGPHLVESLMQRRLAIKALIASKSGMENEEIRALIGQRAHVVVSDRVFGAIAEAEAPPGIAAEIEIPGARATEGSRAFLEGIQDAGNVGAIIRSAAALGLRAVVLDRHCADPWSPKVLRAGMGGHFLLGIAVVEDLAAEISKFEGRVLCTVAAGGQSLRRAPLEGPIGWIFGSEGSGVSAPLAAMGTRVCIPMAPGTESVNVAAAAAICFYEASCR